MNSKHCPNCNSNTKVVKIGKTSSGRQRYRCNNCKKTWVSKPHPQRLAKSLWHDMVFHNLNYTELSQKYGICERTIRSKLDNYEPPEIVPDKEAKRNTTVIAMDVTYFGRSWGILTVIDAHNGKPLYCAPTRSYETIWDYEQAIIFLHGHGVYLKAAIIDGKSGLIKMLEEYGLKVQFCQFHQLKIINKYLTRKPDLRENIDLRNIALSLTHMKHEDFERGFHIWLVNNRLWLNELTDTANTHKREYRHARTRSAVSSLMNNMPYLFTFQEYPELEIPNTNNKIEGMHSDLKRRIANHHGLKKEQKIRFVRIFLSGRTGV